MQGSGYRKNIVADRHPAHHPTDRSIDHQFPSGYSGDPRDRKLGIENRCARTHKGAKGIIGINLLALFYFKANRRSCGLSLLEICTVWPLSFLGSYIQSDSCLGLATLFETLLEMLDRSLEFVDAFRFMCHAASIEIGDYF